MTRLKCSPPRQHVEPPFIGYELVLHHPQALAVFVEDHQGGVAARVRREAINKLQTGLKS